MDTSPVGVLVCDAQTLHPVAVNREAGRILGIPRDADPRAAAEEAGLRRMDGSVASGEFLSVVRSARTGETLRAEELVIERPDGESVSTLVNTTPIRSEDGTVVSVVATVQDITPLEEIERLRAEFLGMVSHELRGAAGFDQGGPRPPLGALPWHSIPRRPSSSSA